MTDAVQAWTDAINAHVESTVLSSGVTPSAWRKAGRPSKDKPEGEDLTWWMSEGERQVVAFTEWITTTDWQFVEFDGEPAIEFPVETHIGRHKVRGYIDGVLVTGDGELACLDYKTGARTPDSLLQLGLYASALEVMGFPRPSVGAFYMTRRGIITKPESLDRYTPAFYAAIFDQFTTAVDNDIFIPHVGSHCMSCSVKDACFAAGGVDAYRYDPMHPSFQPISQHTIN